MDKKAAPDNHLQGQNKLRMKVAKLCGWKRENFDLPDWPNDLNACAEFEKTMDVNQLLAYADALEAICVPTHICPLTHRQAVVCATARQRAEAFVKTMEGKPKL